MKKLREEGGLLSFFSKESCGGDMEKVVSGEGGRESLLWMFQRGVKKLREEGWLLRFF